MPASSNSTLSTASSDPVFSGGGRTRPLTVRRSIRARRMRLAIDPRDGAVKLTLPKRAAIGVAMLWVESQRGWIERALAALPVVAPLGPGATLPFEGVDFLIDWNPFYPRAIKLLGEQICVGGPEELVAPRILRWLRSEARARLEAETRALADQHGIAVGRVRIGDPHTRWGSCSSSGDIAYSWRLILAPPEVRLATIAHELAHRRHMHHGPDFHAEVTRLFGRAPKAERAWLKANGARIQAIGR
jgi:predicted metal-dependent hydrolase